MKIKIGSFVVVRKGLDTPIYTVTKLEDGIDGLATLAYMKGTRFVSGGQMPKSCLLKPTKAQIEAQYPPKPKQG